jgi:transposase
VDTCDKESSVSKSESKGRKQPRPKRQFTAEFKREVVQLVLSGKTAAEVARDLDLTASSVSLWVRQARIDRGQGPAGELTSDDKAELARLRRENKALRMEREILKKAAAFFAKEST